MAVVVDSDGVLRFICGWSWSLGRGLAIRLAQENRDLLAAVVTQQWEVSQLEASLADVRRRISHLVHTDVQGTVAGVGSCCSAQPKSPTKMCQRRWIARFCVWSKH